MMSESNRSSTLIQHTHLAHEIEHELKHDEPENLSLTVDNTTQSRRSSTDATLLQHPTVHTEHDFEKNIHSCSPIPAESESKTEILVSLPPDQHPNKLSYLRRWIIVLIISTSGTCVTFNSSAAGFTETGISQSFHISMEVAILSISLFIEGLGIGPLLLGPLSEFFGRWRVYVISYIMLWGFSWGVAFAPNAAVHLIFRFLAGFSGSAFLSVAGGSVSDLFNNDEIAYPIAVYTMSPFLGPVLGPLIAGFINQNTTWRWTYYVTLIWEFVQFIGLVFFVPETFLPVLTQRYASRLRSTRTPEQISKSITYVAPLDRRGGSIGSAILTSCYKPFEIMWHEPMALLLDLWSALILGILYLTFQAFPIIFEEKHGFNVQSTGLSFIGIGLGMLCVLFTQPLWNRIYHAQTLKHSGHPPPEMRLLMGMVGALLIPLSLIILAFTTYPHVHWIFPILASVLFGAGVLFAFTAIFSYLVVCYREYAASAMAGNSFLRSSFAAGFPLFSGPMFVRLGTVGAVGLLAGLTFVMMPLPFVLYRYGARLRRNSKFATSY